MLDSPASGAAGDGPSNAGLPAAGLPAGLPAAATTPPVAVPAAPAAPRRSTLGRASAPAPTPEPSHAKSSGESDATMASEDDADMGGDFGGDLGGADSPIFGSGDPISQAGLGPDELAPGGEGVPDAATGEGIPTHTVPEGLQEEQPGASPFRGDTASGKKVASGQGSEPDATSPQPEAAEGRQAADGSTGGKPRGTGGSAAQRVALGGADTSPRIISSRRARTSAAAGAAAKIAAEPRRESRGGARVGGGGGSTKKQAELDWKSLIGRMVVKSFTGTPYKVERRLAGVHVIARTFRRAFLGLNYVSAGMHYRQK